MKNNNQEFQGSLPWVTLGLSLLVGCFLLFERSQWGVVSSQVGLVALQVVWGGSFGVVISALVSEGGALFHLIGLYFFYRFSRKNEFFMGPIEYAGVCLGAYGAIQQTGALLLGGYSPGLWGIALFWVSYSVVRYRPMELVSFFVRPFELWIVVLSLAVVIQFEPLFMYSVVVVQVGLGVGFGWMYGRLRKRVSWVSRILLLLSLLFLVISTVWAPYHPNWLGYEIEYGDAHTRAALVDRVLLGGDDRERFVVGYHLLSGEYLPKQAVKGYQAISMTHDGDYKSGLMLNYYMGAFDSLQVNYDSATRYAEPLLRIASGSDDPLLLNNVAIYRCLIGDSLRRSSKEGLEYSYRSNELTGWHNYQLVDTYATCLAAADRWTLAEVYAEKALGLVGMSGLEVSSRERMTIEDNYVKIKSHMKIEF
ncbi:MAG: hypothetical protein OCC49_03980 [Fibrobacterales bacterium]